MVQTVEFRYDIESARFFRYIMFAAAAIAAGGGLYVMATHASSSPVSSTGLTWLVAAIFAAAGEWNWRRSIRDRSVRLAIGREGIFAPDAAAKLIPWADIEKVVLARPRRKKSGYLAIDVADPSRYGPTKTTKAMAKLNQTFGGGEFIISYSSLEGTHLDIRAAILAANPQVRLVDE